MFKKVSKSNFNGFGKMKVSSGITTERLQIIETIADFPDQIHGKISLENSEIGIPIEAPPTAGIVNIDKATMDTRMPLIDLCKSFIENCSRSENEKFFGQLLEDVLTTDRKLKPYIKESNTIILQPIIDRHSLRSDIVIDFDTVFKNSSKAIVSSPKIKETLEVQVKKLPKSKFAHLIYKGVKLTYGNVYSNLGLETGKSLKVSFV